MRSLIRMRVACAAALCLAVSSNLRAAPLPSSFTYQGRLFDAGSPAVGQYDLQFTPYAAVSGGSGMAPPVVIEDVDVVDGVFTATVDFGAGFFVGDAVFLDVAVRPGPSLGTFISLTPRQPVSATPYALKTAAGSVGELEIADASIASNDLADGSVTTPKLADGAASGAKIGVDAVTTTKILDAAVTNPKLADNAVDSAKIADGTVSSQDLDLASIGNSFWTTAGNAPTAGAFLGTTNGQPLELRSDVGVTVDGARFNNNTEFTVRGSPATADTNADFTLWPRGGTAFFNLTALGTVPADTVLSIQSVGTSPFTGYVTRLILTGTGALGIGGINPTPLGQLHVTRNDIGLDAADLTEQYELLLEDVDAQLGLFSNGSGGAGSVIGLNELDGTGAVTNAWGIYRATSVVNGVPLFFTYGTNSSPAANPYRMFLGNEGSMFVGAVPSTTGNNSFVFVDGSSANAFNGSGPNQFLVRAAGGVSVNRTPFNSNTELTLSGSPNTVEPNADFTLWPRDATAFFNISASGVDATDTRFTLQSISTSPTFTGYVQHLSMTVGGSFGLGNNFAVSHNGAFVWADSSAGTFASSGDNQFLVRATGGAALNGAPFDTSTELTVNSDSATVGSAATVSLRSGGNTRAYTLDSAGGTAANSTFSINYLDPGGTEPSQRRVAITPTGFFSINPATPGGGFILPSFPLTVGTSGNTSNGNGAHVTVGGVFTNGSSRTFKEAFTAIDPEAILDRLLDIPLTRWRYKGDVGGWHVGPMAEDFMQAFGLGEDERYIGTVDADGVALAAIQGLDRRVQQRAEQLERENAELRDALRTLNERVQRLEATR